MTHLDLAAPALSADWRRYSSARPWRAASHTPTILALLAAAFAFLWLPRLGSDYLFSAVLVPWLVLSLAGLGLNLLTGYAGQLSVGSAAFMCVGAFAAYNAQLRIPGLPLLGGFFIAGLSAAALGVLTGLPSLRIKGFYVIVSTLAAQFFVPWVFVKFGWFSNYNASGVITAPPLKIAGFVLSSPADRFLLVLGVTLAMTAAAWRIVHSTTGLRWMAVRDMDTAAEVIGIPVARAKLSAFALSAFYLGVAGALWAFAYVGTVEPHGFDLARSFQILFIVILGGLGSLAGAFVGAAFIVLFPIALSLLADHWLAGILAPGNLENAEKIVVGALIIGFLIREPAGLWRLIQKAFHRVQVWPLKA
ncbi:MAG TPA: branched-chain amino acid ABC transporter permease [Rhodocyclaceae bacterium]|nr:branched-chain amino acid ABC transporter permease [Rhodocyclaceae bacterium]